MRALVLSPHTDDAELGMGATIHRLRREGHDVRVVIFAEAPSPKLYWRPAQECSGALDRLGVDEVEFLGLGDTRLPDHRQFILEHLFKLRSSHVCDVVFTPCRADVNQDHATVTAEAVRAFRPWSIFGYHLPWNVAGEVRLDVAVPVTELDVEKKEEALARYESQSHRPFFREGYARARALSHGTEWGYAFAEVFECIRYRWF